MATFYFINGTDIASHIHANQSILADNKGMTVVFCCHLSVSMKDAYYSNDPRICVCYLSSYIMPKYWG
jgi:hypothetical protein